MAISEAEAVVMDVLWHAAPRTAEEILAEVGPAQNWQEGTVKSLLNRLLRKKAVHAERDGRRYLYTPLLTRELPQFCPKLSQVWDSRKYQVTEHTRFSCCPKCPTVPRFFSVTDFQRSFRPCNALQAMHYLLYYMQ